MKNRIILLVMGVILLLFYSLSAQTSDINVLEVPQKNKDKSVFVGLSLSISSTVIPIIASRKIEDVKIRDRIFLTGVVIGPCIGHLYATTYWKVFIVSASFRLGLCLATPYFFREFVYKPWNGQGGPEKFISGLFLCSFTIGYTALSICRDIYYIPEDVRKYNQSHNFSSRLHFVPSIDVRNENYKISVSYNF